MGQLGPSLQPQSALGEQDTAMAHPRWGGVGSGGKQPLLAAVSGVDAQSPPFSEGLAKVFQRRGQTGQLTLLGGP